MEITERAIYYQSGTVIVEAQTLEEAKDKVLKGNYEHTGNNEILLDTEEILEVEIELVYPSEENENLTKNELLKKIKKVLSEYGSFSTGEVEADCSPSIVSKGNLVHLVEYFKEDFAEVVVYDDEVTIDEYKLSYKDMERDTLVHIAELCDAYIEFNKDFENE